MPTGDEIRQPGTESARRQPAKRRTVELAPLRNLRCRSPRADAWSVFGAMRGNLPRLNSTSSADLFSSLVLDLPGHAKRKVGAGAGRSSGKWKVPRWRGHNLSRQVAFGCGSKAVERLTLVKQKEALEEVSANHPSHPPPTNEYCAELCLSMVAQMPRLPGKLHC